MIFICTHHLSQCSPFNTDKFEGNRLEIILTFAIDENYDQTSTLDTNLMVLLGTQGNGYKKNT